MDGAVYDLAFSDEFEVEGRTFHHGACTSLHSHFFLLTSYDPVGDDDNSEWWTAVDEGAYLPDQVSTESGYLLVRTRTQSLGSDTGSGWRRRTSGMVRSRVPFCLSRGFVEVGVVGPGTGGVRPFYVSGFWGFGFAKM